MTMREHSRGLTLVEMAAAMLASTILMISAGVMLVNGYSCWHRNHDVLELQRDATITMATLARAVRGASSGDVSIPLPGQTAELLVIQTIDGPLSFDVREGDLVYTSGAGREVTVVQGSLAKFEVMNNSEAISIQLGLASTRYAHETVEIHASFALRN